MSSSKRAPWTTILTCGRLRDTNLACHLPSPLIRLRLDDVFVMRGLSGSLNLRDFWRQLYFRALNGASIRSGRRSLFRFVLTVKPVCYRYGASQLACLHALESCVFLVEDQAPFRGRGAGCLYDGQTIKRGVFRWACQSASSARVSTGLAHISTYVYVMSPDVERGATHTARYCMWQRTYELRY